MTPSSSPVPTLLEALEADARTVVDLALLERLLLDLERL
jgi:hypothetical protein